MDRYDRQIRLWGQHGQSKLASAHVCLINANSTGTEILKNLCLPGVGCFTIIDSHNVTIEDIGSNFFLGQEHIGKNRGQSAREYLTELNEEVCGQSIEESLESLMSDDKDDFWTKFNCVICCGQLKLDQMRKLCEKCWHLNVPLVICKTLGFIGHLYLQYREHLVIDTHPDNTIADFRLGRPFPKLRAYLDGIQLDLTNDADDRLGQCPYIVIIYKFLRLWQSANSYPDDRMPINYQEKQQLRTMIKDVSDRLKKARDNVELENFQEAYRAVNTALNSDSLKIPDELESIFQHSNAGSGKFWLIIKAIKVFVAQNDGQLPVSGVLPDMASSSANYIELQNIYRAKAREDADQIYNYVQEFNINTGSPICMSPDDVSLFSRNVRHINLVRTALISDELLDRWPVSSNGSGLARDQDEDENSSFMSYHMCLRAVDHFFNIYDRYPGEQCDQIELDIGRLKDALRRNIASGCTSPKVLDEKLYEICRYGGSELHTVASFMAGCACQEVLKLITNQYVPITGCLLYNSISSTTLSVDFVEEAHLAASQAGGAGAGAGATLGKQLHGSAK